MYDENLYKEINKWKKIAISLTIFFVILVIGTSSFLLGRQSAKVNLKSVPIEEGSGNSILGSKSSSSTTPIPTTSPTRDQVKETPSPFPSPIPSIRASSITLDADSRLDGFRSSNGSGSFNSNIRAGRDNKLVTRAFVSFDITDLPEDIEIISAELRLFQTKTLGNPYKSGGDLLIDHLYFGDSLDADDYSTPALLSNFDTASRKPTTGWREIDVTNELINDATSARPFSQFRLHFEKELVSEDENGDFAYFESSENTQRSGNTPELVIEYTKG